MITDQIRSRIYGGTQKALWEQLWNLPESAKSVLQMVTFRLYMISRESQLSERLTPKRSIPDRRSSDVTWQAGCERLAMSAVGAQRKCRYGSLPAAIGCIPENLCSSRAFRWLDPTRTSAALTNALSRGHSENRRRHDQCGSVAGPLGGAPITGLRVCWSSRSGGLIPVRPVSLPGATGITWKDPTSSQILLVHH